METAVVAGLRIYDIAPCQSGPLNEGQGVLTKMMPEAVALPEIWYVSFLITTHRL